MTFDTFAGEMLAWFPFLQAGCSTYMDDDEPLAYIAFGCVLIPWIESRLEARDMVNVTKACEFIEVSAYDGRSDARLKDLIAITLGEWFPEVREKAVILSHLGPETRRVCRQHIHYLDSR